MSQDKKREALSPVLSAPDATRSEHNDFRNSVSELAIKKPENITILRTSDRRYHACKRIRWLGATSQWVKEQYKLGILFTFYSRPIENIDDLATLLEKIRCDPRSFIVRGIPTEEVELIVSKNAKAKLRRLKKTRGNIKPTLQEVPLSWLMLDIDNFPLPDTADLIDDPEGAIDHAIHTLLPDEFHNVRCWWQLSSTAGIDPRILKVHLFFWLSEPKTNAELKQYFSSIPGRIDTSVFSATQPIYVADPIIEGRPDWLPRRTGWRDGLEEAVCLAEVSIHPHLPKRGPISNKTNSSFSGNVDALLDRIGDEEGKQGFYIPTRDAAFRYALETPTGQRDDEGFKARVRTAIRAAVDRDPTKHRPEDVITACSDERIDQLIESAFEKLGSDAGKLSPKNFLFMPRWQEFSLVEARARLATEVEGFMERAIAFHQKATEFDIDGAPAEMAALAVDVGVGKTHTTIHALKGFIDRMKELGRPHRVLYFVPTHRLAFELLGNFKKSGIEAAIFRGREADDLENSDGIDPPLKMCRDLAAIKDTRQFGLDPERAACGSATSEWRCVYFFNCAYQKQKDAAKKADVVIVAHEFLFRAPPKFLIENVGTIIADESFWQSGIETRILKATTFGMNFEAFPVRQVDGQDRENDPIGTKILSELHSKVQKALEAQKDGYLQKQVFLSVGLNPDNCALAARYEFARKVTVPMRPGLTQAQRDELKEMGAINAQIATMAQFWVLLGQALSPEAAALCGRLELKTQHTAQGTERLLVIRRRRDFSNLTKRLPVLMLDATFPQNIMKYFAPNIRLLAEIRVASPHMRITSIIGAGFGKQEQKALLASDADTSQEQRLARQLEFVLGFGRGSRTLVITYKATEAAYEALEGVEGAHFGAVAGRDEWGPQGGQGGIGTLFVIGRPMPAPSDVRDLTVALTGKAIPPLIRLSVVKVPRLRDGQTCEILVEGYEDQDAEAIRSAICEGEVIQAIGRARGVSRTASNPVDVFLMANLVVPLTIDRVVRWEDVAPRAVEALLLRGVLPLSGQDAAMLAPDLFPSAQGGEVAGLAIRKSLGPRADDCKIEFTEFCFIEDLYKEKLGELRWLNISYRRQGRGHRTTQMLVRADLLDGLHQRLTERLGPLALFEVFPHPDHLPAPLEDPPKLNLESSLRQSPCLQANEANLALGGVTDFQSFDLGPDENPGTVVVLGQTPPLPGDEIVQQAPPANPQPLKLIQSDEITSARERLLRASINLEAVRPPLLWGDQFDKLKLQYWRERCAAARAIRENDLRGQESVREG